MLRRHLLSLGSLGALGGAGFWPVGRTAWAAAHAASTEAPRRLVVVFLRGAVDGLNVVVPHADPAYYQARSSIAIAPPGTEGGALDLDGRFGLHPALASLLPLWRDGSLAFVHACGSPDATRSHFDAQDYMESGTPGRKATPDGWLNRLCLALPADAQLAAAPARAVSFGPVLPRILAGRQAVASLASGGGSAVRRTAADRPQMAGAFDRLYGDDSSLGRAYQASKQARLEVAAAVDDRMDAEMTAANNGAPLPAGFPDDAARLARLMRNDPRVQLAFMALGGWDTHANQGGATGQLANRLKPLGEGLAALAGGLGPAWSDTVVVVLSEFGRTVRQNGNGGTDHGHGNVLWLLGGPVAGGRVHGAWPGLAPGALHEGRDLAVSTDFRAVLAAVAQRHLGLPDGRLAEVFPDFRAPALGPIIRA